MAKVTDPVEIMIAGLTEGLPWRAVRLKVMQRCSLSHDGLAAAERATRKHLAEAMDRHEDLTVVEERAGLAMRRLEALYHRALKQDELKVASQVGTFIAGIMVRQLERAQAAEATRVYSKDDYTEGAIKHLEGTDLSDEQRKRVRAALRGSLH